MTSSSGTLGGRGLAVLRCGRWRCCGCVMAAGWGGGKGVKSQPEQCTERYWSTYLRAGQESYAAVDVSRKLPSRWARWTRRAGWWANTDALNAALRGTSSSLRQEASRLGLRGRDACGGRGGRGACGSGGVSVEVFKVFSLDKVQQRLVEQIIETPCVVLVKVWRGSGGAVCSCWTCSRCSHVEIWTLFLRAPLLADTRPRVHATVYGCFCEKNRTFST